LECRVYIYHTFRDFQVPIYRHTKCVDQPWELQLCNCNSNGFTLLLSQVTRMPQHSDSNYAAVTRHRRPFSTAGRPPALDIVDDEWAADTLEDDTLEVAQYEAAVAPLLEEGELDADAIVVSPSGNSSAAANNASERRRREEGWNDLGLDGIDNGHATVANVVESAGAAPARTTTEGNSNATS
jgi:hypothetical protein